MIRKELIKQMVENYKAQVKIVEQCGIKNKMSLRDYLEGIKKHSNAMTQEEVEYGLQIEEEG